MRNSDRQGRGTVLFILHWYSAFLVPYRSLFLVLQCHSFFGSSSFTLILVLDYFILFLLCYWSFTVLPPSKFLVLHCPLSFNVIRSSLFHFLLCFSSSTVHCPPLFLSIAVPRTLMLLNLNLHYSTSFTVPHPSLFLILHRFSSLLLLFSSHLLS